MNDSQKQELERLQRMEARLLSLLAEYEGSGILSATRVRAAMVDPRPARGGRRG